jgi:hypothetical protein
MNDNHTFVGKSNSRNLRQEIYVKTNHAALFVSMLCAAIISVGCGAKSAPPPPPPVGGTESLAVFLKDAPADSALSMQVTVLSVSAVNSSGQSVSLTDTPRTYELKHLSLAPTLATLQNVDAGTYTGITLTFSNPQMQMLDANGNLTVINSTSTPSIKLGQTSVTVPAAFTLASKQNGGVVVDFDLANSLATDNSANFVLTPTLTSSLSNPADPTPQLTDCAGTVMGLAKDGTGFDFQLAESGVTVHVVVDSNTFFDPAIQKLANITTGEILEVTASLKTDGTYQGKAIDASASALNARQQGLVIGTHANDSGQTVVSVAVQD